MKRLHLMALAALLAAPTAFAGSAPKGMVAGYLTSLSYDTGGADDSGTGFGIRGWATISDPWFVHGEYQTVSLDDFNTDIESLRLGGGMVGEINPKFMWLAKGEIIDYGSDTDQAGLGAHGGVMMDVNDMFGWFATLGYIMTDDTDGIEFNGGVKVSFTREFAFVGDYRNYLGSHDLGGDFFVSELRLGIAYMF